jgi:polyhydroxyalkanoate synthesis regulator phasin
MIEAEEKRKETEMKISAEMNDGKMDINLSVDENDLKNADALTEFIDELRKAVTELRKLGASS